MKANPRNNQLGGWIVHGLNPKPYCVQVVERVVLVTV